MQNGRLSLALTLMAIIGLPAHLVAAELCSEAWHEKIFEHLQSWRFNEGFESRGVGDELMIFKLGPDPFPANPGQLDDFVPAITGRNQVLIYAKASLASQVVKFIEKLAEKTIPLRDIVKEPSGDHVLIFGNGGEFTDLTKTFFIDHTLISAPKP